MGTRAYTDERARRGPPRVAPLALLSDEALAGRVRAGDERAFEALYGRYRDRLYRYCGSILRQPEDAEEALQNAMLGAYRSLIGADARELAVRPWLYRIAHNQCIDLLRRRPAHAACALSGLEASAGHGPAEHLEIADELARVREDLLTLPADQRGALVLRELSGLSHEQIAGVLDESAASVKQIIYQARLALTDMAVGRRMDCDEVRRRISDGDGRVLRSRGVGAHLRSCTGCSAFRAATTARPGQLAAIAPALPLAAAQRILEAIHGAGGGLGGGGAAVASAGAASSGALSGIGGGLGVKLAVVAAVSVVGGSVAVVPAAIHHSTAGGRTAPAATTPTRSGAVAITGASAARPRVLGAATPRVAGLPGTSASPAPAGPIPTAGSLAGNPLGSAAPSSGAPGAAQAPGRARAVVPPSRSVRVTTPSAPPGAPAGVVPAGRGTGPAAPRAPATPAQSPSVSRPTPPQAAGAATQPSPAEPPAPGPGVAAQAAPDPPAPERGSAP